KHPQSAIRVVRAVQTRRAIRLQHDYAENVGARSCEGIFARCVARISLTCVCVEADRVDWPKLVDLGGGAGYRVSIALNAHCACNDHAALQQVHAAPRGLHLTRTSFCTGTAHRFSDTQY